MKLHFLIGGMYAQATLMDSQGSETLSETMIQYFADQIRISFPEFST
ncbi:MAG: hypothetical protein Q4C61_16455 [Lachnospiraceae bacterium]|nr:hypothetical protein [Lachnospiraceae bacterium]